MDHPLKENANRDLRKQVIQLFQGAYRVPRGGNIVFVCGGNDPSDMRPQFREYCAENLKEFEIFFPEFAMKDYFSAAVPEPFDIADFEFLVGELSHAIVIFPEAPGSFAETGYFSAIELLSTKTILALDAPRQLSDSFISMGPAKKISTASVYQPNIQIDYQNPTFNFITERIRNRGIAKQKKKFEFSGYSSLSVYEVFCLIHKIVSILSIASIEDILRIMRGLFNAQISAPRVRHIASILVGVGYIRSVGDYGHYAIASEKGELLETRVGYVDQENKILIQLAGVYQSGDPEFLGIVEASRDAY